MTKEEAMLEPEPDTELKRDGLVMMKERFYPSRAGEGVPAYDVKCSVEVHGARAGRAISAAIDLLKDLLADLEKANENHPPPPGFKNP